MKKDRSSIILILLIAITAVVVAEAGAECDLECAIEGDAAECSLFCVSCSGCTLSMVTPSSTGIVDPVPSLRSVHLEPLAAASILPLDILHVPRLG